MDFDYYFENAKECLGRPHVINDVLFKRTSFGHEYVQINYRYKHVEGMPFDPNGHFVSIFYNNKSELEKILKEFRFIMDYNFSLFSKICGLADPDNDITLWVLLNLYEEWIQWNSRFGLVYNTKESMEEFLKEVRVN